MTALGYDDVLLIPQYSKVKSRNDVSLKVQLPKGFIVDSPIVPANMKSVVSRRLALECLKHGSLTLMHRFSDYNDLAEVYDLVGLGLAQCSSLEWQDLFGVSVGVKTEDYQLVDRWVSDFHTRIICVDVAHGDHELSRRMVGYINEKYPDVLIIAGNVCTVQGAMSLWEKGADVVKVGVGPGSACTTRLMTGCGYPQFTALEHIYHSKKSMEYYHPKRKFSIIADGGIVHPGDAAKALIFADLVMMGGVFAECVEAENEGVYQGSSTYKSSYKEGTTLHTEVCETVDNVYNKFHDGIRSACSYVGVDSLYNLKGADYVQVSSSEQHRDRYNKL